MILIPAEVIDKCFGCDRINALKLCMRYAIPEAQWTRLGGCPSRTHNRKAEKKTENVDPIKASKRSVGKK